MTWQQVYQYNLIHSDVPVFIDYTFTTSPLIVKIQSPRESEGFNKAGLIWLATDIPEIGRVRSHPFKVYFTTQYLEFILIENRPYSVEYLPWNYLSYINLTFYHNPDLASGGSSTSSNTSGTSSSTTSQQTSYFPGITPGM